MFGMWMEDIGEEQNSDLDDVSKLRQQARVWGTHAVSICSHPSKYYMPAQIGVPVYCTCCTRSGGAIESVLSACLTACF